MEKLKIGLIPLDSRPVNTVWIKQLADIANVDLLMYPRNKCSFLNKEANRYDIINYIKSLTKNIDYLIISSDALVFGGLIQARTNDIDINQTLKDLAFLKSLKKDNPKLKIYVFDTIMRITITLKDEESRKYYDALEEYTYLLGKYYFFKENEVLKRIKELEKIIPQHIIDTFLNARKKKLKINKHFLHLANQNIIDYLILLQEDSKPFAVSSIDQEELKEEINKLVINNKISFYNGTDEGGAVLLAKAIMDNSQKKLKTFVHLANDLLIEECHEFEDRPFKENLNNMLKVIGLERVQNVIDADFVLSLFKEKGLQRLDLSKYVINPIKKDQNYYHYINTLNQYIKEKPTVLVDLQFANGGNIELIDDLNYRSLLGYSAWNTSSNSLGTALAQAVCSLIGNNRIKTKEFLYERIMDDCIYQYIVRRKINEKLIQENISPYYLHAKYEYTVKAINDELLTYHHYIDNCPFIVSLPWDRTFEIEIKVKQHE